VVVAIEEERESREATKALTHPIQIIRGKRSIEELYLFVYFNGRIYNL